MKSMPLLDNVLLLNVQTIVCYSPNIKGERERNSKPALVEIQTNQHHI